MGWILKELHMTWVQKNSFPVVFSPLSPLILGTRNHEGYGTRIINKKTELAEISLTLVQTILWLELFQENRCKEGYCWFSLLYITPSTSCIPLTYTKIRWLLGTFFRRQRGKQQNFVQQICSIHSFLGSNTGFFVLIEEKNKSYSFCDTDSNPSYFTVRALTDEMKITKQSVHQCKLQAYANSSSSQGFTSHN